MSDDTEESENLEAAVEYHPDDTHEIPVPSLGDKIAVFLVGCDALLENRLNLFSKSHIDYHVGQINEYLSAREKIIRYAADKGIEIPVIDKTIYDDDRNAGNDSEVAEKVSNAVKNRLKDKKGLRK